MGQDIDLEAVNETWSKLLEAAKPGPSQALQLII